MYFTVRAYAPGVIVTKVQGTVGLFIADPHAFKICVLVVDGDLPFVFLAFELCVP